MVIYLCIMKSITIAVVVIKFDPANIGTGGGRVVRKCCVSYITGASN